MVPNEKGQMVSTRPIIEWRICMDYQKLNTSMKKDNFPLPFIDQILGRLTGRGWYYFLDRYFRYNQISIALEDQNKTTFTCVPMELTFKWMPLGLCNALATF